MSFKVLKSGGESTGSADGYKRLQAEVQREVAQGHQVVVVVSAPAISGNRYNNRVTELLRQTSQGNNRIERITQLFEDIANPSDLEFNRAQLEDYITQAQRPDDYLFLGEHLQAQLFAEFLGAQWIDARDALVTDENFGAGKVLHVNTTNFQTEKQIYVVGGFYGRSTNGQTVTLSKGGSDLTADVIAASLNAVENCNLKEVRGIFAADPRIVSNAEIVRTLTYRELRELAYGGNTVLQEEAMSWCRRTGIPMRVRSLLEPNDLGTRILRERDILEQGIVGIAAKEGFTIYTIHREDSPFFFQSLLSLFAEKGISVDMIGTEDGIVSLAIEEKELAKGENINYVLDSKYKLKRKDNQTLISVVGEGITDPLTLQERIVEVLDRNVSARYGPILGGRASSTTTYYIEKFGMNSERGIAERIIHAFVEKQALITGISTTIDSISIGTPMHDDSRAIQEMCAYLGDQISPDSLSVTRNGIQRYGRRLVPSNVTVAVDQNRKSSAVNKLYLEFF